MKKLIPLLFLLFMPLLCSAEVLFGEDQAGLYIYPEGAAEADALYVYHAVYPRIEGDHEIAELINNTYAYLLTDAFGFECPMNATSLPADGPQMKVSIVYEVTHQSDSYLSIKLIKTVEYAGDVDVMVTGHVFALQGDQAGVGTSLPYLLGILEPNETDDWYLDRQIAKADKCARELVWEMLTDMDIPLHDDMTFEEFEYNFYPEEDFYLNAAGDVVFYLPQGIMAPAEYGVIECVVPMETLLDEI